MKLPRLELVPIQDAGTTEGNFNYYATVLAPLLTVSTINSSVAVLIQISPRRAESRLVSDATLSPIRNTNPFLIHFLIQSCSSLVSEANFIIYDSISAFPGSTSSVVACKFQILAVSTLPLPAALKELVFPFDLLQHAITCLPDLAHNSSNISMCIFSLFIYLDTNQLP